MWTLAMIAVGILIGWQIPQPEWTKKAMSSAWAWTRDKFGMN